MSIGELARELGIALPASFSDLPDEHASHLLTSLRKARSAQSEELERAVTAALNHVPRPLRGAVRKAVGL